MKSALEKQPSPTLLGHTEPLCPGHEEVVLKVAYMGLEGNKASAVVEATGEAVTHVSDGDRVVILTGENPSKTDFIDPDSNGICITLPGHSVHPLPEKVSLKHGALIEILATSCQAVKSGQAEEGEICIVVGGGPLGLTTSYLLRNLGAHVILADTNRSRLDGINSLGFATLDMVCEDLGERIGEISNNKMADLIFQFSGSGEQSERLVKLLNTRGRLVLGANPGRDPVSLDLFRFFWSELRIMGAGRYEKPELEEAIRLASSKAIPLDFLVTRVGHLKDITELRERMKKDPGRMSYLVNCL